MILRNDHFFLSSAAEMREIAKPLLALGITYFSYGRHYNNGGRLWLCNAPENVETYYLKKLYLVGNSEAHPSSYQSQVVSWSTLPNQRVFENARNLGIDHGIFIIEPKNDYILFTFYNNFFSACVHCIDLLGLQYKNHKNRIFSEFKIFMRFSYERLHPIHSAHYLSHWRSFLFLLH